MKRIGSSILGDVGDAAINNPFPHNFIIIPNKELTESILEGSFYEIDHSKLPPRTPAMLRRVRAVMVTAKSELNVTIRYPSAQSLEAYFGNFDHVARKSELYPALDEKFIMGPKLAVEVLRRPIPSRGFEELRHSKSFWLINPFRTEQLPVTFHSKKKQGPCFSKLHDSRIKGWGHKQLVVYVPNSEESDDDGEVKGSTLGAGRQSAKEETEAQDVIHCSRKRKPGRPPQSQSKKTKHTPKQEAVEVKPKIKGNNDRDYVDRWPSKRYEAAGMELMKVLKTHGADHVNPMSRLELRTEARKRIGDTGLLDHMLKHLAGQVVPLDGNDRLRRRCDTEGKMEYWLESADLVNLRKEAGVKDPYWIPPPGWKVGDSINHPKCLCRREINMLKDELSVMRRQMAELKTKDEDEQPITMVMPATAASSRRETYEVLMKKKCLVEEQLLQISNALRELEEDNKVQCNKAEVTESLQLMPSASQSLPVEEMNEDLEAAAAAAGEFSESHGEVAKKDSQAKRLIVKLQPCRHIDTISNTLLPQEVGHSVQDLMALTSASGSPLSTTTS